MTTITTETPEQTLASALAEVAAADQYFEQRRKALDAAQAKADATTGFTAAAELNFSNLEANYRVLRKSAESTDTKLEGLREEHERLQAELTEASAELERARNLQTAVKASHNALEKAAGAAGQFLTKAETAVTALEETATKLDTAADTAGEGHKKDLRDAYRSVKAQHDALDRALGTLKGDLGTAQNDVQAVPDVGVSAEEAEVARLERELRDVDRQQTARHPSVSQHELDEAKDARDSAQRALQAAPETERKAMADLQQAQTDVAAAEKRQATALAALDRAESAFIAGIALSQPDPNGRVTATARLRPPYRTIPAGYELRWSAAAATVTPETGVTVTIDTSVLPVGDTPVVARLEPTPAKP